MDKATFYSGLKLWMNLSTKVGLGGKIYTKPHVCFQWNVSRGFPARFPFNQSNETPPILMSKGLEDLALIWPVVDQERIFTIVDAFACYMLMLRDSCTNTMESYGWRYCLQGWVWTYNTISREMDTRISQPFLGVHQITRVWTYSNRCWYIYIYNILCDCIPYTIEFLVAVWYEQEGVLYIMPIPIKHIFPLRHHINPTYTLW